MPVQSRQFLEGRDLQGVITVFYRIHKEHLLRKAMRKLKCLGAERSLSWRVEVVKSAEFLSEVCAAWMSPTYIPPPELDCLLNRLPGLKWLYCQTTGIDHLNLASLASRGLWVSNTGTLSSRRVAEMALACIVSHAKRLPHHFALQRRLQWKSLACDDLSSLTVGVIGTGNIGRELACQCKGLGIRVLGASRDPSRFGADTYPYDRIVRLYGELDELLGTSDIVVLAVPLTPETRGIIGARQLSKMKTTAALINVARGALVNEKHLCRGLRRGTIAAAYLDVVEQLPPPVWSRLYRAPNLLMTHNSSATSDLTLQGAFDQFWSGVDRLRRGEEVANRVC
jgi:phosphoglycerate dehydrogenase-like enzyme